MSLAIVKRARIGRRKMLAVNSVDFHLRTTALPAYAEQQLADYGPSIIPNTDRRRSICYLQTHQVQIGRLRACVSIPKAASQPRHRLVAVVHEVESPTAAGASWPIRCATRLRPPARRTLRRVITVTLSMRNSPAIVRLVQRLSAANGRPLLGVRQCPLRLIFY